MFKNRLTSWAKPDQGLILSGIVFTGIVLAGCNGSSSPVVTMPETQPVGAEAPAGLEIRRSDYPQVRLPDPATLRDEGLVFMAGEAEIRIGDLESESLGKVPRDRGALEINDPVPVTGTDLRTRGWANERRSFSLTTHGSRVVLVLDQRRNVSPATLQAALRQVEAANGPADDYLGGQYTNYRFWQRGPVRLMLVDTLDSIGGRSMAVALGQQTLMDALRMNLTDAQRDQEQAARMLSEAFAR